VPPPIGALAARQYGVVTRAQLIASGLGSAGISLRVRDGRLHRIHPGVYAVGHPVLVPRGRYMAAVLAGGGEAALSHGSSAALRGVRGGSMPLHVTVPRTGAHSRPGLRFHRVRSLDPADVEVVDGIRVTTMARTALDLAETSTPRSLAHLLERMEQLELFDLRELQAVIARNPGRHGIKVLADALDLEAPRVEELQRRFLRLVREAGLPEPLREAPIGPYRADFHWPAADLVVETDGRAWHATRAAFERDRLRDLELAALGIRTVRVTWRMVTRTAPQLAATLRRLADV
jgi:very-short-patch-repair endonuclease